MSEDTTTVPNNDEQANESSQPVESIEVSAESVRSEQPQNAVSNTQEAEPSSDDNSGQPTESNSDDVDLKEWAKSKGINPDDPDAILKLARDTEKGFRQYSQKAKKEANELKKQVSVSPDLTDSESVIQEARILNFYNSNPEARDYDQKMGEIYSRFQQTDPDFAGHLVRHLDTLYAMAKAEDSTAQVQQARQEGKNEAIQATKKAQVASTPKVNATTSAPPQKGWTDDRVQQVIANGEYDKYRNEILAWERSQYL